MNLDKEFPALYGEIASWWPVLSTPEDYAEEAAFYREALVTTCASPPETLLELGSGGGNNASHLKVHFRLTLVDRSEEMLMVSQKLNPECEHLQGDMRNVRLGRQFDALFIHDAIGYMTCDDDLAQAIETAYIHCKPGGAALFAPDHTRETFRPATGHGGHDRGDRSLRYLDWTFDPDEGDSHYLSYMVYLLREGNQEVRCVLDRHQLGLFSQADWLRMIEAAGFRAKILPFEHSEIEPGYCHVFLGIKEKYE